MEKSVEDLLEEAIERMDAAETTFLNTKKEVMQLVKTYSWSQGFIGPLRLERAREALKKRQRQ